MQQIANTVLINQDKILMIKKPSKNWYSAPGGKMEFGESVLQAAIREFYEETGLRLINPKLSSVFTFVIEDEEEKSQYQWMMHTFVANDFDGELLIESKEGKLEWVSTHDISNLPMAEGDRLLIEHAISPSKDVLTGTFLYTNQFKLLNHTIDIEYEKR